MAWAFVKSKMVFPVTFWVEPTVLEVWDMPVTVAADFVEDCPLTDVRFLTVLFMMALDPAMVEIPLVREPLFVPAYALVRFATVLLEITVVPIPALYIP